MNVPVRWPLQILRWPVLRRSVREHRRAAWALNADAIALVVVLGLDATVTTGQRAVVVSGAAAMIVLVAGIAALREDQRTQRLRTVAWRNLDVRAPRSEVGGVVGGDVPDWALAAACVPLFVGGVARRLGASAAVSAAGVIITVLCLGALTAASGYGWLRARRTGAPAAIRARLSAALAERQPQVLFYVSGPDDAAPYLADPWLPVLERLPEPVLVVVRNRCLLDAVRTTLPVVFLPRAGDVQPALPRSIRLALYPAHDPKNNHVIRLPGITDVFVGHGDSDKAASSSRLVRAYDETWVSGPAGRARYVRAGVRLRNEQIREVGRPQVEWVQRRAVEQARPVHAGPPGTAPVTVLYAPTCPDIEPGAQYSSVPTMGATILASLAALPDVRVLVRPHPGGDSDARSARDVCEREVFDREVRAVRQRTATTQNASGSADAVDDLYDALNAADVLITDIGAVLTDFTASGKPYVVTNPAGLEHAAFRTRYPSAAAAYLLDPDCRELPELLNLATGADPMRAARAAVRDRLLGDLTDPFGTFAAAVHDAVERDAEPVLTSGPEVAPGAVGTGAAPAHDAMPAPAAVPAPAGPPTAPAAPR